VINSLAIMNELIGRIDPRE